jgi:hypothetical protein
MFNSISSSSFLLLSFVVLVSARSLIHRSLSNDTAFPYREVYGNASSISCPYTPRQKSGLISNVTSQIRRRSTPSTTEESERAFYKAVIIGKKSMDSLENAYLTDDSTNYASAASAFACDFNTEYGEKLDTWITFNALWKSVVQQELIEHGVTIPPIGDGISIRSQDTYGLSYASNWISVDQGVVLLGKLRGLDRHDSDTPYTWPLVASLQYRGLLGRLNNVNEIKNVKAKRSSRHRRARDSFSEGPIQQKSAVNPKLNYVVITSKIPSIYPNMLVFTEKVAQWSVLRQNGDPKVPSLRYKQLSPGSPDFTAMVGAALCTEDEFKRMSRDECTVSAFLQASADLFGKKTISKIHLIRTPNYPTPEIPFDPNPHDTWTILYEIKDWSQ